MWTGSALPHVKLLSVHHGGFTLPCVIFPATAAGVIFAASGRGFWSAKPVDNEVSDMPHIML
jgi:hypothetical protein